MNYWCWWSWVAVLPGNFPKLCMCANMTVCFLNEDRVFFRFSEGFMTYKNLKSTALEFHFFVFLLEFQALTMFEV